MKKRTVTLACLLAVAATSIAYAAGGALGGGFAALEEFRGEEAAEDVAPPKDEAPKSTEFWNVEPDPRPESANFTMADGLTLRLKNCPPSMISARANRRGRFPGNPRLRSSRPASVRMGSISSAPTPMRRIAATGRNFRASKSITSRSLSGNGMGRNRTSSFSQKGR